MGLRDMFSKMQARKAFQAQVEQERAMMKNIEQKEINPNEREVLEFREKHRQKQIVEELKQWKQLARAEYNKGTFLTKDYYFRDNSVMSVPNQFAGNKQSVLKVPPLFSVKKIGGKR